ncbi:hypothetical protein PENTCL1PPCAC_15646, partial [Pristionchus entomophagus]
DLSHSVSLPNDNTPKQCRRHGHADTHIAYYKDNYTSRTNEIDAYEPTDASHSALLQVRTMLTSLVFLQG